MGRALILWLMLALPAGAGVPDAWLGGWSGEGVLRLTGEGDARLRCQIRLTGSTTPGRSHLSGRCATARGARGFAWVLDRQGADVTATSQDPPAVLTGRLTDEVLALGADGVALELRASDGALELTLSGDDGQMSGTGTARLTRQD